MAPATSTYLQSALRERRHLLGRGESKEAVAKARGGDPQHIGEVLVITRYCSLMCVVRVAVGYFVGVWGLGVLDC